MTLGLDIICPFFRVLSDSSNKLFPFISSQFFELLITILFRKLPIIFSIQTPKFTIIYVDPFTLETFKIANKQFDKEPSSGGKTTRPSCLQLPLIISLDLVKSCPCGGHVVNTVFVLAYVPMLACSL